MKSGDKLDTLTDRPLPNFETFNDSKIPIKHITFDATNPKSIDLSQLQNLVLQTIENC